MAQRNPPYAGAAPHSSIGAVRKLRRSDLKLLLERIVSGWAKHNTPRLAAALAFYTLLSLMPLLLVVTSVAGLVFGPRAAETGIMQQIQLLIGAPGAKIIAALLRGTSNRSGGLLATGLGSVTLLLGASGMLRELRSALNTIWDVAPRQLTASQEVTNVVKERLRSFGLVLTIALLLTGSLLLSTGISAIAHLYTWLLPSDEVVLDGLNAIFSFALLTGLFAVVYKVLPGVTIEWRDVAFGAAATSLLFTLGNIFLGLYLGTASFSSTYGAAASAVVLTLWVYYSSQIFFLGAEFTKLSLKGMARVPVKIIKRAATTVVVARVGARQHFPGDVVAGPAMGWFMGDYVYGKRHNDGLDAKRSTAQKVLDHIRIGAAFTVTRFSAAWEQLATNRQREPHPERSWQPLRLSPEPPVNLLHRKESQPGW